MSGRFEGRVVLVTGGSTGIGRAAALAFAREGARVAIGNRTEDEGEAVVSEIDAAGGEALFVRTDVTDPSDLDRLHDETVTRWNRLDVAFNNAGGPGRIAPFAELEDGDLDEVLGLNVRAMYQAMLRQMRLMSGAGGVIVNNASVNGLRNEMMPHMGLYTASKHAVVGLTKAAALDTARTGVRVNAVAPGPTRTDSVREGAGEDGMRALADKTPMGRLAEPDEIAGGVLYLASDEASYVTGHVLCVDGGYVAS